MIVSRIVLRKSKTVSKKLSMMLFDVSKDGTKNRFETKNNIANPKIAKITDFTPMFSVLLRGCFFNENKV